MHLVIAGASGFLGTHLVRHLRAQGHSITRLVRSEGSGPDESRWDPYQAQVDAAVIQEADVVINLAGSPTAGNPHSRTWARELEHSRVTTTQLLATTIANLDSTARPAFLAGNGISFYGDHGSDRVTERAGSRGDALLTRVTKVWQQAAEPAAAAGARVVILRTSPVLDARSAPLKLLAPLFKLGLGGKLGSGRQYFPVISLRDWVSAVSFAAAAESLQGPVNLCTPQTPTNAEFTQALASRVQRPALFTVPAPILKPLAGAMAPEVLGSINAVPQQLLDAGFVFSDPEITSVIAAAMAEADPH